MKLNLSNLERSLREATVELLPMLGLEENEAGIPVFAGSAAEGFTVKREERGFTIAFDPENRACFCRALGFLKDLPEAGVCEKPRFEKLRYMADMSRNGMLSLAGAKRMIRYLALMGFNDFSLYLEDGYEIPGYPYFGRNRAKYSENDLKEMIRYGALFGVSITPCVQTLAHFEAPLAWSAMKKLRDTRSVLYVGSEEVYNFLDAELGQLRKLFNVVKFNIGMDEAHGLGRGKKLEKEGLFKKSDLMAQHLKTVAGLCEKHGIQPMIWSDMFFRPYVEGNGYYSDTVEVPQDVIDRVPAEFTLVYWDYSGAPLTEKARARVENMFAQHKRFRNPIAFAGGTWKWMGYAPNNRFSEPAAEYYVKKCMDEGITDITVTAWGDDGAEGSAFGALIAPLVYAERLYGKEDDLAARFEALFGIDIETYRLLDLPNAVPDVDLAVQGSKNPSKYLFYADPVCGKLDAHVLPSYKEHFAETYQTLAAHADHPAFGYIFRNLADLCNVLQHKATLGLEARAAYEKGDKEGLLRVADTAERAAALMDDMIRSTRARWYAENKLFGYEALEMRMGAIKARLLGAAETLRMYVRGELESLEMLEEPLLPLDPGAVGEKSVLTVYAADIAYPATWYSDMP